MPFTSGKNEIYSGNAKIDTVYHTAEWLITAFASTLVFIVFIMQVYRIPTGSMAETLRGAHFRVRCAECGYRYDHDFLARQYGISDTLTPSEKLPIVHQISTPPDSPEKYLSSRCPNCGYSEPPIYRDANKRLYTIEHNRIKPPHMRTVFKGDQIFVLKSIYQFFQPKRWDVIVFKNPTDPRINYIKRCIGLPNETIEIVDGDVYVDKKIQRKPDKVQEELWMVIYDNDYQPAHPQENEFNGHNWQQPFEKVSGAAWNLAANGPSVFELDTDNNTIQRIRYNNRQGNDFRATYAYDDPSSFPHMPICSDLMVSYNLDIQNHSAAGAQIRKYGVIYQGWLYADGKLQITRLTPGGQPIVLEEGQCDRDDLQKTTRFRFATVDHQVVLEYGSARLVDDLGTSMNDAGANRTINPEVQIMGYGKLKLTHIGLYRDIHYINEPEVMNVLRGTQDNPMILKDDEYFACGDNSPFSADSRLWPTEGLGNNGQTYPAGVVPKDYLVGKGIVVHWPGGYRLGKEPIRWIPYVDGIKIIYGGKD
ncbi:MAG: signal peptidase I [Phycisphaerae bacterium]|nr:signal peptidase I [Phycisphaerae bacterium]